MKKSKFIIILVFFSLGVFWLFKRHANGNVMASNGVWVQAMTLKESTLPLEIHAIGNLVGRSVDITPEVAGQVRQILFKDGSFVKKDMPLIQLDDALYKAKYQSTKAQLTYSQNNFHRMTLLGKMGAIAKQTIEQSNADLKQKQASAEEDAVMLTKLQLTAPFDGIIGQSKVNLGDYVTAGQHVVSITDTKHLRVEYDLPEKYLSFLHLNQTVKIITAVYPGKTFSGTVAYISPTINTDNRSISLYAEIENNNNLLKSGMFVDVMQSLGTEEHVVMVPARSLVPIFEGEQVYKVINGKAYATTVITGKRFGDNVQIIQGIVPNDVVITDGQLKIRNGMEVKVKNGLLNINS